MAGVVAIEVYGCDGRRTSSLSPNTSGPFDLHGGPRQRPTADAWSRSVGAQLRAQCSARCSRAPCRQGFGQPRRGKHTPSIRLERFYLPNHVVGGMMLSNVYTRAHTSTRSC
jgi:hypothetical protein